MENTTLYENSTINYNGSDGEMLSYEKMLERFAPTALIVDRIVSPIWYVIGFIGNPISVIIWLNSRIRKNNSSAVYLGTLAIVHTVFLILHFIMELHYAWNIQSYNKSVLCELFNVLLILPQYFAPLLVLAFTIERYIAVCHPFSKEKFCTNDRAIKVTIGLGVFSAVVASPQAYIWSYVAQGQICMFSPTEDRFHFEHIWTLLTELLIFFVVPALVLIFNILVVREIKRFTLKGPASKSDNSTGSSQTATITLLSVSFYLICTLLPASVVYALQSFLQQGPHNISLDEMEVDPMWNRYFSYITVRKFVEEICLSNNACYVFIYYITGPHFRKQANNLLGITKCKEVLKKRSAAEFPTTKPDYTLVSSSGKVTYDCPSTQVETII